MTQAALPATEKPTLPPINPFARNIWRDLVLAIIFIASGYIWGVFTATIVGAVGALVLVLWAYLEIKKIDWTMLGVALVSFAFVLAAYLLNDPGFVKFRPTFSSGVFALIILVLMLMGVSFTERTMGAFYVLSAKHWRIVDSVALVYILMRGALNYWVAISFSDATWLWYSSVVSKGIGVVYAVGLMVFLNKVKQQERDIEELFPPPEKRAPWVQKLLNAMKP
jgi:intracellular septation protein